MEEKNSAKVSLLIFLLILAIIAIIMMGIFIYKLNNDKITEFQKSTELQAQVNILNGTISELQGKINNISETINSNMSNENTTSSKGTNTPKNFSSSNEISNSKVQEKDYDNVILDGSYAIPNTDSGWDFSKDGKAAYCGNISINQGTYKTTGKNSVEIHYTKSKLWDEETGNVKISDIDSYDYITVDDDNNVYWTNPNGKKVKLEKYGEASKENFE